MIDSLEAGTGGLAGGMGGLAEGTGGLAEGMGGLAEGMGGAFALPWGFCGAGAFSDAPQLLHGATGGR